MPRTSKISYGVPGISPTSLWGAWKVIRKNLGRASMRDVIDFLDYDLDPDVWINRLLRQIRKGTYEPAAPLRFTVSKSKGFSRRMAFPRIPDLVLYRAVIDYLHGKARPRQHKHAYFEVKKLAAVQKQAAAEAHEQMATAESSYELQDLSTFLAWLRFDQYRKYLIFDRVFPFVVVADIANFFDSVLYDRVAESLRGRRSSARMIGLLFFLLERLSIREAYTESPRIGLPVDEFNCSRKLAHLMLFPHDDRMVTLVGEDAYVRWMDDQNIGVESRAHGLKVLAAVDKSLARLHLTPNTGKSHVLSLAQARRHFHLDLNKSLDALESLPYDTQQQRRELGRKLRQVWNRAKEHDGVGEWEKLLKRVYRLAGLARVRTLRRRALKDMLRHPKLSRRILDYVRCSGEPTEYIDFVEAVVSHDEQVYPDVNLVCVETLLREEAGGDEGRRVRRLASALLKGEAKIPGASFCRAVAPLLILRFGDRRSLPLLKSCFAKKPEHLPHMLVRSAAVVFASYGCEQTRIVRKAAAKSLRGHLAEVVLLIDRILEYEEVPGRYKNRLRLRFDSVLGQKFLDMRSLVAARLLGLNTRKAVQDWLSQKKQQLADENISDYDRGLLRLWGAP